MSRVLLLASAAAMALASSGGCTLRTVAIEPTHPLLWGDLAHAPLAAPPHHPHSAGPSPVDNATTEDVRARIAAAAGSFVGSRNTQVEAQRFRMDCSGVARAIYQRAGLPLQGTAAHAQENDVSILFRYVQEIGSIRRHSPRVGDLVFFDDTYDRNRDGLRNDPLSHIGVVERIMEDGTVVFVHHTGGGILRYRMNLAHPRGMRSDDGAHTWNHYLRRAELGQPAKTTAELFVAFGTVAVSDEVLLALRR